MARPSKNILSSRAIARAALTLVERTGDFTIPGIAALLKVNPSSLYHHLPGGRAAIVHRMREELYAEIDVAALEDEAVPAEERLRTWMRATRAALAQVPASVPVLVASPVQDARTLQIYEALFVILRDGGVPPERRVAFSAMVDLVVLGSAIDALSPTPLWRPGDETPELQGSALEGDDEARASRGFDLAVETVVAALRSSTGR
jgi:AcrR family transcriptional regulator